jgi:hypothetical protein
MVVFWGLPSRSLGALRCAVRAVATLLCGALRGSLTLGPFGSGATRHRFTSLGRVVFWLASTLGDHKGRPYILPDL